MSIEQDREAEIRDLYENPVMEDPEPIVPMPRWLVILLSVVLGLGVLWVVGIYMLTFGLGFVLSLIF